MPKSSKVPINEFRAEAWRGINHLMSHFGVTRSYASAFASKHGIKIPYSSGAWNKKGVYRGFNQSKESLRAFLDRTGVNDVAGRADDEIILAAIRLRRRGMKPQQIGPILGISGDKLLSVYQQTQAVRAADIKASGEPAGRVMKDYW